MSETEINRSMADLPPADPDLNSCVYGGIINYSAKHDKVLLGE